MKMYGDFIISKQGIEGFLNMDLRRSDYIEDKVQLFDIRFSHQFELGELLDCLDYNEIDLIGIDVRRDGDRCFYRHNLEGTTPAARRAELNPLNKIKINLDNEDYVEVEDDEDVFIYMQGCSDEDYRIIDNYFISLSKDEEDDFDN